MNDNRPPKSFQKKKLNRDARENQKLTAAGYVMGWAFLVVCMVLGLTVGLGLQSILF